MWDSGASFRKVAGPLDPVEGGCMPGDIDVSGYVLTRDEWLALDEEVRTELSLAIDDATAAFADALRTMAEETSN